MPVERFKHERHLEFEEAQEKGTLDSMLCPPPTPTQIRVARLFGFAALAVGTVLAVGMITAVLFFSGR